MRYELYPYVEKIPKDDFPTSAVPRLERRFKSAGKEKITNEEK